MKCRARYNSGWVSTCRPSEKRPGQRPHLSCPLPQSLAEPTQTERTEASAAPSLCWRERQATALLWPQYARSGWA